MLSRLIAALALVTGLASFGAPVEARALAAASQQIEASASEVQVAQAAVCADYAPRSVSAGCAASAPTPIADAALRPMAPAVRIRIDRAHE
ncbi:hypothetical protein D6858_12470 [Tsuneonella suprasediminis]|uniref:UrcA family protein n=1 Tax=Tsuneonella suprasediminis TaxID=2306996 RepID=A0A419QZA9_9SPHN|nr:hypothetical protein [Tsuneonella suprasediminis]RJX66330.1 hypothetical protein D6858_12470 [Tsuneonella suprasediminis]